MTKNIPTPKRVLAVFAHPDDMDFSSSGTMAKWAAGGAHITYLVCTDGSKGSDDPKMTPAKLAQIRKGEQEDAARVLGVAEVIFLKHPDGELVADYKLKGEITKVIRHTKPDVVVTLDPTLFYSTERGMINHSDHRAAGLAAMDAVYPIARDRLNFPEHEKAGLAPHKTKTLLFVSWEGAEHFEDISATFEKKIEALRAHASQVPDGFEKRVSERAEVLGKKAKVRYAEGFKKIELS
jgi:LmbE family N-acetylglucosaminyl deacetylase